MIHSLQKIWKNEEGFTLLEAVLSIATLALISGFILQMFIVSAAVNSKAKMMDKASAEAQTVIETMKGFEDKQALYQSGLFAIDEENDGAFCRWYDQDWNPVADTGPNQYGDLTDPNASYPQGAAYGLQITLTEMDMPNRQPVTATAFSSQTGESQAVHAGDMLSVQILAVSLKAPEGKRELVSYTAQKYYAYYE